MKRVKNQDKTLAVLIVGVVLMLALTVTLSFAYFTAKATSQDTTLTFGVLEIDSDSLNGFTINSNDGHVKVVPGCTLEMDGTIKLKEGSNVDAFVRIVSFYHVDLKAGDKITFTYSKDSSGNGYNDCATFSIVENS